MGETHRNQVFKPSAQRGCGIGRWHIKPKKPGFCQLAKLQLVNLFGALVNLALEMMWDETFVAVIKSAFY